MTGGGAERGAPPTRRLVILGASNVRIGLPTILRNARRANGGPIDLMAALGHGRSYGKRSSIPGRSLPAISECRLWGDLARGAAAPTRSFVTDIGNDLLYGRPPEQVVAWVRACAERLTERGPVTLTELPIGNLDGLGEWRYRAFRTLFFPGLRLSLARLTELALTLNDGLRELAADNGYTLRELPAAWYGVDPIHFRRKSLDEAWGTLLDTDRRTRGGDSRDEPTASARCAAGALSIGERARVWSAAPAERSLLGCEQRRAQPTLTLNDGTRLSLY